MDEQWNKLFAEVYDGRFDINSMRVQRDTLKERAEATRPILVELAENGEPGDEKLVTSERNTTSYGALATQVGSSATYIAKVLAAIDLVGAKIDDPPLSPLVESARTVGPGRGYFNWEYLGEDRIPSPGDKNSLTPRMKETWRRHLRATYAHENWYQPE